MRLTIFILTASLVCAMGCSLKAESTQHHNIAETDTLTTPGNTAEASSIVSLAFVGDVMMGTNFPDSSYITRDRGRSLFEASKQYIASANFAVANLEGTLYYGSEGMVRKMTNPQTYYIFRTPGDHAINLVNAGFDAVGMANNHSNDFGTIGRQLTLRNLNSVGLAVTGLKGLAEQCVVERSGVKFGFLQFAAACTNTLDLNNKKEVEKYITGLRTKCDILVVTFHGGAEGKGETHVPMKTEYYVGEDRGNVHDFAHQAIDLGADIVVGHGPHVPRGMELYRGHLIAYSLGNFCTPFRMNVSGVCGLAPLLVATISTADGKLVDGRIHSFRQRKGAGPQSDSTHGAARLIRALSQTDFPRSALRISDDGLLSVNN